MRYLLNRILLMTLVSLMLPMMAAAQSPVAEEGAVSEPRERINEIQEASGGNIVIDIDEATLGLIFSDAKPAQVKNSGRQTQKKKENTSNRGYRVQVFGEATSQSTLASRCRARGSMVLAKFPKYRGQIYIFSKSPNWYCRVGNFKTAGEAAKAAGEIRRAFPQFAGDVRTVKSTIVNK